MSRLHLPVIVLVPLMLLVVSSVCQAQENCQRVEHTITLLQPGSRSEARQGFLNVDCYPVPDTYEQVVVDGQVFEFFTRQMMWGNDGYHPTGESFEPVTSEDAIGAEDLERGWTLGGTLLAGTPANWIYVKWAQGEAWVDPEFTMELAQAENIAVINRQEGMEFMPSDTPRALILD